MNLLQINDDVKDDDDDDDDDDASSKVLKLLRLAQVKL